MAPVVMAPGADAGDWVQASIGELPAATVTATPSAITAATASFRI